MQTQGEKKKTARIDVNYCRGKMRPILRDQLWEILSVSSESAVIVGHWISVLLHGRTSRWSWQRWFLPDEGAVFVAGGHIQPGQLLSEAARVQTAPTGETRRTCPVLVNQALCFFSAQTFECVCPNACSPTSFLFQGHGMQIYSRSPPHIYWRIHKRSSSMRVWQGFLQKSKKKLITTQKPLTREPNFLFPINKFHIVWRCLNIYFKSQIRCSTSHVFSWAGTSTAS